MASRSDQPHHPEPVPDGVSGHLALYRAWRPQRFHDVVGQEHVTRTLRNAIMAGRIGHAYLFSGPRGTGKTSVAKILARAVNCLEPGGGEPCDRCEPCRTIGTGRSLDVLEIDAASHRGIEEIRDLREKVKYSPSACRTKAYIIDEVHMLTPEAFNALLKTLEEPPSHVLFILATTESHKIPATILSRCQRFDFHRLGDREITGRLREVCGSLGVEADDAALFDVAHRAEGGLRDALSLLDQCLAFAGDRLTREHVRELLGAADEALLAALAEALAGGDAAAMLRWVDRLDREGKDTRQVVRDLIALHRDLLFVRVAPGSGEEGDPVAWRRAALAEQAGRLTIPHLLRTLEGLARLENDLRWSTQPRLTLEVGLLGIIMSSRPLRAAEADGEPAEHAPPAQRASSAPPAPHVPPVPPAPRTRTAVSTRAAAAPGATAPAAAPAETPAPAAAPAVQDAWRTVTERIRKLRPPLYAFLQEARPVALEGNRLVLGFGPRWDFHRGQVARASNRAFLEQMLREVLGMPVTIDCILVTSEPGAIQQAAGVEPDPFVPASVSAAATVAADAEQAAPAAAVPPPAAASAAGVPDGGRDGGLHPVLQGALELFGGKIIEFEQEKASGEE